MTALKPINFMDYCNFGAQNQNVQAAIEENTQDKKFDRLVEQYHKEKEEANSKFNSRKYSISAVDLQQTVSIND